MLLPVDDDGRDLLIHEDEDGGQERGQRRRRDRPDRVGERIDNPAAVVTCRLSTNQIRARDLKYASSFLHKLNYEKRQTKATTKLTTSKADSFT